jgi:hypothetical protein
VLQTEDVVQKPFDDGTLLEVLRRACRTSSQQEALEPVNPTQLFWSKRGEIACWTHAPSGNPERWHTEKWAPLPDSAWKHRVIYQCQHCPGNGGPVRHQSRKQENGIAPKMPSQL